MPVEHCGPKEIVVAMTGASGAAYGLRLLERLGKAGVRTHLLISDAARIVLKQETGIELPPSPQEIASRLSPLLHYREPQLACYALDDWFSPAASGSSMLRHMIIVPCSMGTLARIAVGASDNVIERAADVMLKERGRLILVPRETPLSAIHLEHMLKLARLGVDIIPAMPGFYHKPERIEDLVDFVVDRLLDHLGVDDGHAGRWGG